MTFGADEGRTLSADLDLEDFLSKVSRPKVLAERFLDRPRLKQETYDAETEAFSEQFRITEMSNT